MSEPSDPENSATQTPPAGAGQEMWGGRFSERPADLMQAINVSIGVDKRLWRQDLAGSRAHCRMLAAQGIIQPADADAILGGLDLVSLARQMLVQQLAVERVVVDDQYACHS